MVAVGQQLDPAFCSRQGDHGILEQGFWQAGDNCLELKGFAWLRGQELLDLVHVFIGIDGAGAVDQDPAGADQGRRILQDLTLQRDQAGDFLVGHGQADLRLPGQKSETTAGNVGQDQVSLAEQSVRPVAGGCISCSRADCLQAEACRLLVDQGEPRR